MKNLISYFSNLTPSKETKCWGTLTLKYKTQQLSYPNLASDFWY